MPDARRQQEVAGEDGLQVAPLRVHRVDAAPRRRFIHHVVVVERTEVHELARDPALHGLVGGRRTGHLGGGDREHGPQPLATGDDEVRGDLGQVGVGCHHRLTHRRLDPPSIDVDSGQREQRRRRPVIGHADRLGGFGQSGEHTPVTLVHLAAWPPSHDRSARNHQARLWPTDRVSTRNRRSGKGDSHVRTLHRQSQASRRAGAGGSAAAEPQLHRHRAHPPGPHPRR